MNEYLLLILIPIGIAFILFLIWLISLKLKLIKIEKFIERIIDDVLHYPV